ncbi:hypothetical protein ACP70R_030819 [Stipagrostis hirtigluma subsp. patula]
MEKSRGVSPLLLRDVDRLTPSSAVPRVSAAALSLALAAPPRPLSACLPRRPRPARRPRLPSRPRRRPLRPPPHYRPRPPRLPPPRPSTMTTATTTMTRALSRSTSATSPASLLPGTAPASSPSPPVTPAWTTSTCRRPRGHAHLLLVRSPTGEWVDKDVRNPEPDWIWNFSDVISHDGKLWRIDTAACLLACDPLADHPDMDFVPLPGEGKSDDGEELLQEGQSDDDEEGGGEELLEGWKKARVMIRACLMITVAATTAPREIPAPAAA